MNFPHSRLRSTIIMPRRAAPVAEEWSLARLWSVVRRRSGYVALATLCALAAAVVYVSLAPTRYTATAALITDTKRSSASPTEVTNEGMIDPGLADSQVELLKSEKLAEEVIKKLNLTADPEFLDLKPGWATSILRMVGLAEDRTLTDEDKIRAALPAFKHGLKVLRVGRSYVTEISYTSLGAKKAAAISNELAQAYIQDQLSARFGNVQRAGVWMTRHIDELRREADDAARALQDFKAAHQTIGAVKPSLADPQIAENENLAAKARVDLAQARVRSAQLQTILETDTDESRLPDRQRLATLNDPTINRLAEDYAKRVESDQLAGATTASALPVSSWPDANALRESVWRELRRLVQTTKAEIDAALLKEQGLQKLSQIAQTAPPGEDPQVRLKQLETNAQAKRSAYENMANRSARITQFIQQQSFPYTDARIITEAVPPLSKSSPRTGLTLLLAGLAGGMAGLACAFGRDTLDRGIGDGRLGRELGARTFGPLGAGEPTAPLDLADRSGGSLPQRHWTDDDILHGLKGLIERGLVDGEYRAIGTVSSRSGEGRQTLAVQLAMLLGRGRRVLLIDADLRARSLTNLLTPQSTAGLIDVLEAPDAIDDALVPTPGGFMFLGAGSNLRGMHPTDWLGSPPMAELMKRLQAQFDCILVDLPAVLEYADVAVCDRLVDAFVMIADARCVTVDDVRRALDSADVVSDHLIGVVEKQGRAGGMGSYF
jgi:succinoglycan biosynthesis transport protein ExoP